jgi:hypothetical protein
MNIAKYERSFIVGLAKNFSRKGAKEDRWKPKVLTWRLCAFAGKIP